MKDTGPRVLSSTMKCLETLNVLSISGTPMSLGEVSLATNKPKPATYQQLQTLRAAGLVNQTERGDYCISLSVLELSRAATTQHGASPEIASSVARLAMSSGEATTLAVREGENALMIHRTTTDNAIQMSLGPGSSMPLTKSASGAILLAFDSSLDGSSYLDDHFLDKVRNQEYVVSKDEFIVGITTIAAPVTLPGGRLGALSIATPSIRFNESHLLNLLKESRLTR